MKQLLIKNKASRRTVRHTRIRARILGSSEKPRLSVYRSLKAVTAQLIDDATGKTLAYETSAKLKVTPEKNISKKVALAFAVGKTLAESAKAKGITEAVFDRGGYRYHGRVAAVADGARSGGLKI